MSFRMEPNPDIRCSFWRDAGDCTRPTGDIAPEPTQSFESLPERAILAGR